MASIKPYQGPLFLGEFLFKGCMKVVYKMFNQLPTPERVLPERDRKQLLKCHILERSKK
jgi:hypothetical protein